MIDRLIRSDLRTQASEAPTAVRSGLSQSRTTLVERFLLMISVVVSPLQNYFPAVAGMSTSFLLFAMLAAYVIVNRPRTLGETWHHPVFIAAYAFVAVSALLEYSSPLSNYEDIIRFAQMIGGAVCVAVLCRDRSGLTAGLCGYIGAALWVSVVLYSTGYETLQGMQAENFHEASKVRTQAFAEKPMGANLNGLALGCTQGAIIVFILSLSDRFKRFRILLVGIAGFCLIASFLPMSRGAATVSLVSVAVVLYAHGVKQGKTLILASILGLGILAVVPDAVWSRMMYSTQAQGGKMEARARLYTAALNRLPEYIVAGVGAGNFVQKWGFEKGFAHHRGDGSWVVVPTHNTLVQITINWGVLGLLMFLWIIWCVYRSVPLRCGRDELSLALLGIIVSAGLILLQSHGFYGKHFSFVLGMLVGARRWIWPSGIVSAVERNGYPPPAIGTFAQTVTPGSSKG